MKNKLFFYYAAIIFFILFFVLTFFVHVSIFKTFDFAATQKLQNTIPRIFDLPFSLFSIIGSAEFVALFLFIIVAIYNKSKVIITLLFFVLLHIFELFFKSFFYHPSPPHSFLRYVFSFSLPSSGVQTGSSYPSGHAARTLFVSIIFAFVVSKLKISVESKNLLYLSILFFDALMLVSRVYLGEHWTTDVMGGSLLGALFGSLSLAFL